MIGFKLPGITKDAREYLRKFGDEARQKIKEQLEKIGKAEVGNTQRRLMTRSTASGDIYHKVADSVGFDIIDSRGPNELPILRFGSGEGDDFAGVEGSRSKDGLGNIAYILKEGFGGATVPKTGLLVRGAKKKGGWIYMSPGFRIPSRPKEEAFLDKAEENIERNIKQKIPDALRKAFDEVKV